MIEQITLRNKKSCSKIISPYFTLVHQWKPRLIEQYEQFTTKCSAYYFDKAIARILSEKVI